MNEANQKNELYGAQLKTMRDTASASNPLNVAKSVGQKLTDHWLILLTAGFFDVVALVPFASIVTNPMFGLILFLYFGSKNKTGSGLLRSELMKIGLPVGIGTVLDTLTSAVPFIDLLPFNVGAAAVRIILS